MDDHVQHLPLDLLARESRVIFQNDFVAGEGFSEKRGPLLDLEFFGAGDRDAEADRDVVGDVVAADCQHPAVAYGPVEVDDVIGDAAANIHHERSGLFLVVVEHDLCGGQGVDHHVLDDDVAFLHAPDGILHPRSDAMDDVKIRL